MKKLFLSISIIAITLSAFAFKIFSGRTAEVTQKEGVYIFHFGQKPVDAYEYLGVVEAGSVIKNYKPDYLIPLMLKKLKDKYPTADGLVLSEENNWKAEAIKFK